MGNVTVVLFINQVQCSTLSPKKKKSSIFYAWKLIYINHYNIMLKMVFLLFLYFYKAIRKYALNIKIKKER